MDLKFMYRAIELAKQGEGFTNPNPLVGAVIVKNGNIIGEGYHEKYGECHAERNAILSCREDMTGAEIYVTLEPCVHQGKQPPCTSAIIAAGIKQVYVGSYDPNPLVSGKSEMILRENGVNVIYGILEKECDRLNPIFFHYIKEKTPYVIMKAAMTLDGRCATCTGDSRWITNELSRKHTHLTRKRVAAIMVGINTVICDNPMLNCRCDNPVNPIRIVCDSGLHIPLDCELLKTAKDIPVIVATVSDNTKKADAIKAMGAQVIVTHSSDGKVNLRELMSILGSKGIDSVLVEGGGELHASMLREGLVNKLQMYIAPKIIGGCKAKPVVGGDGVQYLKDAYLFKAPKITQLGDDVLIEYERV